MKKKEKEATRCIACDTWMHVFTQCNNPSTMVKCNAGTRLSCSALKSINRAKSSMPRLLLTDANNQHCCCCLGGGWGRKEDDCARCQIPSSMPMYHVLADIPSQFSRENPETAASVRNSRHCDKWQPIPPGGEWTSDS